VALRIGRAPLPRAQAGGADQQLAHIGVSNALPRQDNCRGSAGEHASAYISTGKVPFAACVWRFAQADRSFAVTSCAVLGSGGAFSGEQEDALWRQVLMARPARQRVFEPSSKCKRGDPHPGRPPRAEPEDDCQVAQAHHDC
jgi:hypothetical protein